MNTWLEFWQARDNRERRVLVALACLIVIAVVYLALVEPAVTHRAALLRALPGLRAAVARMQGEAGEAERLAVLAQRPVPAGENLTELVAASLRQHGIASAQITRNGSAVRLDIHDVAFADWVAWLDDARLQLRLKVQEAHIKGTRGGQVELTALMAAP